MTGDDLDLPLHAFADAARRLVDNGLARDVGRCPGAGCGWLFLRNGRERRWCVMALCGNRAKARRFADRRRAAAEPA
jgi:predicted RNA-binding Zn ribbon-like protein